MSDAQMPTVPKAIVTLCAGALLLAAACVGDTSDASGDASYVGGEACAQCHQEESSAWSESHHDLAMQTPSEESVLGDFSGVTFEYYGRPTTFFRRDGAWAVRTDGPDGSL